MLSYKIDYGPALKGLDIDNEGITKELVKFGLSVERSAKQKVPRRTGNLAEHIVTEKGWLHVAIVADTKPPPYKMPEQRGSDYALPVEEHVKPYMEPALRENIGDLKGIKVLKARAYKL